MPIFDGTHTNFSYSAGLAPGLMQQYYERALLENMQPELVHSRDGQKRTLPEGNGKRVQFRKFSPFGAVTKPLAEGITPDGQTLTQTAFTAMVKPYGAFVEMTDETDIYHLDNIHQETVKLLSDQAALSLDTISRDALNAGMNVQYAGANSARATIAATDKLTYAEIKKAVRTLKRNNVKPFPDGYYHCIVHPDSVYDLTSDTMWVDVAKYQDKAKVEKYELGTIYKVKVFESTNAKVFKGETYLFGSTASLDASADYDATNKCMTYSSTAITEDIARELTGKMVYAQYTASNTDYVTPMCIERIDPVAKKIYFRWTPAATVTNNWTTTKDFCIVPQGAGASSAAVYSTLVYGQDAFGTVELGGSGKNVSVILKEPGSSGALDPLNQRATVGWKVKGFCTVILQDDFIVRIEHGATA